MIHIVIGTKAQFIKMAPVMVRLKEREVPYRYISEPRTWAADPDAVFGPGRGGR